MSANARWESCFLVWIFRCFIDSSEINISKGSSSQIQIIWNVSKSTFLTHRQTDRQTDRLPFSLMAFRGHSFSFFIYFFFFSWRKKRSQKFYLKKLSFHVLLKRFKKAIWITWHIWRGVYLQYKRSNTFLAKCSFLKDIKKTTFSWLFPYSVKPYFLSSPTVLLDFS